jgi:cytoskeletal protein RodZ
MKTSTFLSHAHRHKIGHKNQKSSIKQKKEKHLFRRLVFKTVIFIVLVGILWIYGYLFLRILNKRGDHFDTATVTTTGSSADVDIDVDVAASVGSTSTTNIIANTSSQNSDTKTNTKTNTNSKQKNKSKAVLVIATAPFHYTRALALWSQL